MTLKQFLLTYPDTDINYDKDHRLIIEAYNEEGDIIDTYLGGAFAIQDYFERKFGKNYPYSGNELIAEEFNGSYSQAFDAIKEDLS